MTVIQITALRVFAILCAFWIDIGAAAQPVFFEVERDVHIKSSQADYVVRSRSVTAEKDRLLAAGVMGELRPTVELNMFNDVVMRGVVEQSTPTSSGYALAGVIDGLTPSSMTIVVNGDVIVGEIHTPSAVYLIRTASSGRYTILEMDPRILHFTDGDCGTTAPEVAIHPGAAIEQKFEDLGVIGERTIGSKPNDMPAAESGVYTPQTRQQVDFVALPEDTTCKGLEEQPNVVDMLVVYTHDAVTEAQGKDQLLALFDQGLAYTNLALSSSGVKVSLRITGTFQTDYIETGNKNTDLARLSGKDDGYMDDVHPMRNACIADIVYLVVGRSNVRGVASTSVPFGLIRSDALVGVWAHEIGHNFGVLHDRWTHYEFEKNSGPTSYRHAHAIYPAPEGATFDCYLTRVAYNTRCGPEATFYFLQRFSNPNNLFLGVPMGIEGSQLVTGVDGPSNAVRIMNQSSERLMNQRPRARLELLYEAIVDSPTMRRMLLEEQGMASSRMPRPSLAQ
ncbi:MAG: M12 family metallo-peptidase [Gammaproteobacteria bacterium]|nr:M12 family metallo-peptidase [Gammaproteobacteria bacterium]